jgi:hypothetical protein
MRQHRSDEFPALSAERQLLCASTRHAASFTAGVVAALAGLVDGSVT